MSCRLDGFDYTRPLYYMVTLKKRPGVPDFSALAPSGAPPPRDDRGRECWLLANGITRAFARTIRGFAGKWRGIAPIEHFIVMPDHLHLLLKIEQTPDRLPLGTYVFQLEKALAKALWEVVGSGGKGGGTVAAPPNTDDASASVFGPAHGSAAKTANSSPAPEPSPSPDANGFPTATRPSSPSPSSNPSVAPAHGLPTAPSGAKPCPAPPAPALAARAWEPS